MDGGYRGELLLFSLHSDRAFAEAISRRLRLPLSECDEQDFADGERKVRPLGNVRERDVYVLDSLYADDRLTVHDKLCRLLFLLGDLRDALPDRITLVIPYLCYSRADRKDDPRDPLATRYVARLFEALGVDRIVTLEVHSPTAVQNAYGIATEHLQAAGLFVDYFAPRIGEQNVAVVSPDAGGIKRARHFGSALSRRLGRQVGSAFVEKQRRDQKVSVGLVAGDVAGRAVILYGDMISTGATVARAAQACQAAGAAAISAAATHGLFAGEAGRLLADAPLEGLVVTNTVPPFRLDSRFVEEKVTVLDAAELLAGAIRRLHAGESPVELLEG